MTTPIQSEFLTKDVVPYFEKDIKEFQSICRQKVNDFLKFDFVLFPILLALLSQNIQNGKYLAGWYPFLLFTVAIITKFIITSLGLWEAKVNFADLFNYYEKQNYDEDKLKIEFNSEKFASLKWNYWIYPKVMFFINFSILCSMMGILTVLLNIYYVYYPFSLNTFDTFVILLFIIPFLIIAVKLLQFIYRTFIFWWKKKH